MRQQRFPRTSYSRRADRLSADLYNWLETDRYAQNHPDDGPVSPWIAEKRRKRIQVLDELVNDLDAIAMRIAALV